MTKQTKPAGPHAKRLGRGLSSLIGQPGRPDSATHYRTAAAMPGGLAPHEAAPGTQPIRQIPVERIAPSPYQPRRQFAEKELQQLADSIRRQGILQPLIVTESQAPDAEHPFVIVAGERRLRAAKLADLPVVPCIVRQATPQQMLEWALIENLQRADLNPIERAEAYRQYMDRFSLTQAQASERLDEPRTTVANHLRLLELDRPVQEMIAAGQLSLGHAKVLAGLSGHLQRQLELASRVLAEGMSVRKLEEAVAEPEKPKAARSEAAGRVKPAFIRDLEDRLAEAAGTRVTVIPGRRKNTGRIVLDYYSLDDFDRIAGRLGLKPDL